MISKDFLTIDNLRIMDEELIIGVAYSAIKEKWFSLKRFYQDYIEKNNQLSRYVFKETDLQEIVVKYRFLEEVIDNIERDAKLYPIRQYYYMQIKDVLWIFGHKSDFQWYAFVTPDYINECNLKVGNLLKLLRTDM